MSSPNFGKRVSFQDAKSRTMTFDERISRIPRLLGNSRHVSPRESYQRNKKEQIEAKIASGNVKNRPTVYQIKFMRAARIKPDAIFKAVSPRIANFKPYLIRPDSRGNVILYVTDEDTAEALEGMSKRLCDPNDSNFKIQIYKNKLFAPWIKIPPENVQIIKKAIQSRYNDVDLTLDLTDFSKHPEFISRNLAVSLNKNEVMIAVADIIDEDCPNLKALSLKNNGLKTLDYIANLIYRAPKVTCLDLSNNPLDAEQLQKLKGWNLETLLLENCPIAVEFTTDVDYINAVHEVFPSVTCLDGCAVQPKRDITEGLNQKDEDLPAIRPGFCPDAMLEQTITKFLVEYMALYDGENGKKSREKLFDAYDEEATFTCVQENMYDGQRRPEYPDPDAQKYYRRNSHNIVHEDKWGRYREKIVRKGRMAIAAELSQMPLTTHVMDSFVLDVYSVASDYLSFNLQGLFKDGTEAFKEDGRMCYFSRTFVVLPREGGKVCIANDMLTVSAISDSTRTRYKNLLTKAFNTAGPSTLPQSQSQPQAQRHALPSQPPHPGPSALAYDRNDPAIQQQMVTQFSQQSGMKPEFSRKCLEEYNWDFDEAASRFLSIKDQVPKEYFL